MSVEAVNEIQAREGGSIRNLLFSREIFPVAILLIICLAFTIMQPSFLTYYNFLTVLTQLSTLLILTVGMTMIILMGRIDLSTGGVISFCSVSVALLFPQVRPGRFLPGHPDRHGLRPGQRSGTPILENSILYLHFRCRRHCPGGWPIPSVTDSPSPCLRISPRSAC